VFQFCNILYGPLQQIGPFKGLPSQTEKLCRMRSERLHTGREDMHVLKAQADSYVVRRQTNFRPKLSVYISHTPAKPESSAISHIVNFQMMCAFTLRRFYYLHIFFDVAYRYSVFDITCVYGRSEKSVDRALTLFKLSEKVIFVQTCPTLF
jgi:hypothetical protein